MPTKKKGMDKNKKTRKMKGGGWGLPSWFSRTPRGVAGDARARAAAAARDDIHSKRTTFKDNVAPPVEGAHDKAGTYAYILQKWGQGDLRTMTDTFYKEIVDNLIDNYIPHYCENEVFPKEDREGEKQRAIGCFNAYLDETDSTFNNIRVFFTELQDLTSEVPGYGEVIKLSSSTILMLFEEYKKIHIDLSGFSVGTVAPFIIIGPDGDSGFSISLNINANGKNNNANN